MAPDTSAYVPSIVSDDCKSPVNSIVMVPSVARLMPLMAPGCWPGIGGSTIGGRPGMVGKVGASTVGGSGAGWTLAGTKAR